CLWGFRPRKTTTEARRDFQPQQTTKPHEPTHTKKPRTELRVSWRGQVRVISWIVDAAKTLSRKQEHTDLLHRDTVLYAVIERPPVNLIEHGWCRSDPRVHTNI